MRNSLTRAHSRVHFRAIIMGLAKILGVTGKSLLAKAEPHDINTRHLELYLDSPAGRIRVSVYEGDRWSGYMHKYDGGAIRCRFDEPMHAMLVLKGTLDYNHLNLHSGKWNYEAFDMAGTGPSKEYLEFLLKRQVDPFLAALKLFQPKISPVQGYTPREIAA